MPKAFRQIDVRRKAVYHSVVGCLSITGASKEAGAVITKSFARFIGCICNRFIFIRLRKRDERILLALFINRDGVGRSINKCTTGSRRGDGH